MAGVAYSRLRRTSVIALNRIKKSIKKPPPFISSSNDPYLHTSRDVIFQEKDDDDEEHRDVESSGQLE
jgi:NAD dependent epimerase/dehydratase family enzyme